MSAARMPAQVPVVVGCPRKTHADGRELRIFDEYVEICFYCNLRTTTGLEVRDEVACIVVTRSAYDSWLRELAPKAMEALALSARCTAMN
jgi:flavin-dependent dehydrogenase